MVARICYPGCGGQNLAARILVAKMMKKHPNSYEKSDFAKKHENEFHIGFRHIGLENVAVAATHRGDRSYRTSLKAG